MSFLYVRNTLVSRLEDFMGIPIVLSDQAAPVPEFPFAYYNVITSYAPDAESGNHEWTDDPESTTGQIVMTRSEQPHAMFSFTFCSVNRWSKDADGNDAEPYIYGDDEAHRLAEKAQGFLLHGDYDNLSNRGIVIVDILNAANRTTLMVDEAARRYGFDVRIRYSRVDRRTDETAASVAVHQKKE